MNQCKPPHLFVNSRIVIPGLFKRPASCWATGICRGGDRPRMIVLTELRDNPGASVTNLAEVFAWYASSWFCPEPDCITWVEHYPHHGPGDETFDFVRFSPRRAWQRNDSFGPAWFYRTNREILDEMLGTSLAGFMPSRLIVGSTRKGR